MTTPSALAPILDEPVGWRFKGWGQVDDALTIGEIGNQGWRIPGDALELPLLVLREDAVDHNIAVMAAYCREHGVSLAPHGKTTMAPQLFHRQLEAGAWAITVATVAQARVCHRFGVSRVLLANELLDPAALRWVTQELEHDPTFELLCLVDSHRGLEIMDAVRRAAGAQRRMPVLVEVGVRSGARSPETACAVAEAVLGSETLELAGIEAFEGVIDADHPDAAGQVDALLRSMTAVAHSLDARGGFAHREEILLTAGGSMFFDRVPRMVAAKGYSRPTRVVLRSGCYVTHDHGLYARTSPLDSLTDGRAGLRPALELWTEVLSRPEPERAIAGFGRRDAPFDAGLPVPLQILTRDGQPRSGVGSIRVTALNDQHAYLDLQEEDPLEIGDRLCCGISHPCTAFDRWQLIPVVDAAHDVTGAIRTFF